MQIKILPAYFGDAILISYTENSEPITILIDGGIKRNYRKNEIFYNEIQTLNKLDLLVLTHPDDDHIGGIIKLFQDNKKDKSFIKKVWYNSGNILHKHFFGEEKAEFEIAVPDTDNLDMSYKSAYSLEQKFCDLGCWDKKIIQVTNGLNVCGAKVNILSPTNDILKELAKKWAIETNGNLDMSGETDYDRELKVLVNNEFEPDNRIQNISSIAFTLEIDNKIILLLGDSLPDTIEKSLTDLGYSETNKIKLDLVKVSHHGSKYNTTDSLMKMIDCKRFAISANGSNAKPYKECLARIINTRPFTEFYFNYEINNIFLPQDYIDYKDRFKVFYLCTDEFNYTINI